MGARTRRDWLLHVVGMIGLVSATIHADATIRGGESSRVSYSKNIRPLLRNKCWSCHSALKQEGELRLDAGKLIETASIINLKEPGNSKLLRRLTSSDESLRMPLRSPPLNEDEIDLIREWIRQGATYPKHESIPEAPDKHWSFQPIKRPEVPAVRDRSWSTNPIDAFVLAKLEAEQWSPNPRATKTQLLRRIYLDLIGLPPTIEEQHGFATHENVDQVIDELLKRDGYGERYARHWLDVARYADSNGYERDAAKPEVWRFRDYVIRALNRDKPFDRFIVEQIAGDELADATTETVIATGFHRLGPWDDEPADFAVDRYDQLDDIVNTTSQAFLGLTMGCARCHDHKFDPLLQTDYYSMVAVFNPLKRPQDGRRELSTYAAPPEQTQKLVERDKKIAGLNTKLRHLRHKWAVELVNSGKSELDAELQDALRAEKRTPQQEELVRAKRSEYEVEVQRHLTDAQQAETRSVKAEISRLEEATPSVVKGYFLIEESPEAPTTRLLRRGNPATPGPIVKPSVPEILVTTQPAFLASSNQTTRRRLSLARWLVGDNPLVARVIVNRVWQWHFGQGIVRTPNDFGLIGDRPTHPKLLDWLAHWFANDAKWSLKKLHKLIMSSQTYQMSTISRSELMKADPENRLLWRHSPHRLEVEAIRDSMLAVSGQLNREMYGPPVFPFVPREALLTHADKTKIWPAFDEQKASRRTVYAFIKRSLVVPLLEVLDLCDVTQTSPKRKVTTVPTQALTMFNGNFALRQAGHFADRILREVPEKSAQKRIVHAFQLALARQPTPSETKVMVNFLTKQQSELAEGLSEDERATNNVERLALVQLCRVIFNLNEFVYPN